MDKITWQATGGQVPVRRATLTGSDAWGNREEIIIEWRGIRVPEADEAAGNVGKVPVVWFDSCPVRLVQDQFGRVDLVADAVQVTGTHAATVTPRHAEDRQMIRHPSGDIEREEVGEPLRQGEWRIVEVIQRAGDRPLDITQAAELVGVSVSTLRTYRRDGVSNFPTPDGEIGGAHWWWRSTVTAWNEARAGHGGRPRKRLE